MSSDLTHRALTSEQVPIIILDNPIFVGDNVFISAGMDIIHPNAIVINDKVWVNKAFLRASDEIQKAMVAHELGHIHYKHTGNQRHITEEIEADLYASLLVGKESVLNILQSAFFIAARSSHIEGMSETMVRIHKLLSQICSLVGHRHMNDYAIKHLPISSRPGKKKL